MADQAVATPSGLRLPSSAGDLGIRAGEVIRLGLALTTGSWVQRLHPLNSVWSRDEEKQRASYIGDRQHLTPFLVPHRFEGFNDPTTLTRAQLSYGIGLNSSYLHEIFGHLRSSTTHYSWGPFGATPGDQDTTSTPSDESPASRFWLDITGNGVSWRNFFYGDVLEWMLTSPGSLILVDSNRPMGIRPTLLEVDQQGYRSTLKNIPFSWVEDLGRGRHGYRWIKIAEDVDSREPDMRDREDDIGIDTNHLLYELLPSGQTQIRRFNDDGDQLGETIIQRMVDGEGRPCLPFIENRFGTHPDIPYLGTGLLMGLDDIVIDLFNILSEVREGYRSSVFDFLSYRGGDAEGVQEQLKSGTRLVHIGESPYDELKRVAADGTSVTAGLSLLQVGINNWSLSAKRRAADVQVEQAAMRSGVSLKAEYQLDLVPLMVSISEKFDQIETQCMYALAQMEGLDWREAKKASVRREREFQMEQEASRIARIVGEFLKAIPGMPSTLLKSMMMRWAESIDFIDLDAPDEDNPGKTMRESISSEATEIAEADQKARIMQNQLGIIGASGVGAAMGGTRSGGGAASGTSAPPVAASAQSPKRPKPRDNKPTSSNNNNN